MNHLLQMYRAFSAPAKPMWRGGSWRLPGPVAGCLVIGLFVEFCRAAGLPAKFCIKNLLDIH